MTLEQLDSVPRLLDLIAQVAADARGRPSP